MAFDQIALFYGVIILLAYIVQAITGFGSTVIALSLGVIWYSLDELLPFLIFSNILFSSVLVFKHWKSMHSYLTFQVILPGMLLGMVVGYLIKPLLNDDMLKQILGVLIIWVSVLELHRLFKKQPPKIIGKLKRHVLILLAGMSHGVFASGGPLMVYTISGFKVDKTQFRATVVVCLFIVNCILTSAFLVDDRLAPVLPFVIAVVPIIFMAVKIGNHIHGYINEQNFKKGIFILLLISGLNLVVSGHSF